MERNPVVYPVDGEVGRFCFGHYDVKDSQGETVFHGRDLFPRRQGKQWYLTEGFHEQALLLGSAQQSYRKFQQRFNRWRRQTQHGTPLNTLRDASEREGLAVLTALTQTSEAIVQHHHFDQQAQPCVQWDERIQSTTYDSVPTPVLESALEPVHQQMDQLDLGVSAKQQLSERVAQEVFELPAQTINLSLDDVGVKKQKSQRAQDPLPTPKNSAYVAKHPKVQNSVAYVEHQQQHYTLTGRGVPEVLLFCLALLLNTGHVLKRLCFFTDGQTSLQQHILNAFRWHPSVTLLLDWYHLVKKCKELLSTAIKTRELRNQHARAILRLLWFGAWPQAVDYLNAIADDQIKNQQGIEKLLTYLQRNRPYIGCYAMRRQLGLRNSSNRVERSNFLVTAERQKKNAMSWSDEGSYALTALNALVCNGYIDQWIQSRQIPLQFVQPEGA